MIDDAERQRLWSTIGRIDREHKITRTQFEDHLKTCEERGVRTEDKIDTLGDDVRREIERLHRRVCGTMHGVEKINKFVLAGMVAVISGLAGIIWAIVEKVGWIEVGWRTLEWISS